LLAYFSHQRPQKAGTGEAVMKKSAIIGSRRPPRIGCIAIIGGALLSSVAAAGPAQSADLYPHPYPRPYAYPYQYQYSGYPSYNGYYRNCYSCCNPCCCGYRPYVRPAPVVERHWDYWERRYPWPYPYRYPYYSNGYAGYPNGYTGYPNYPYPDGYSAYGGGPRPRLGFGGVQYQYPQGPAPISYENDAPPGAPYDYQAAARPAYDYEASPRPPAGMPGGYYNAGYVE
jgi:hypothetical protein